MKVSNKRNDLRNCLIFWLTQSFSSLGSAMTSFALIVWSYQQVLHFPLHCFPSVPMRRMLR